MIKDITELNFPKDEKGRQYATLSQATVTLQDMGDKTITSQVRIDGQIAPDFSYDWEVEFKGEKYIMPLRQPQGAKENTSLNSVIDLTFQHWAIYQLKRWYFCAMPEKEAGTAIPDQYIASVSLNLKDFCKLMERVLDYYFKGEITIDFNDPATHENGWEYKLEPTTVEISHSYIWDVLIKLYELYAVRWHIEPRGDKDHYVIKVGYPTTEISHIFEYGFEGGLLKVERQVQDENIRNMVIGRGGSKNLPYRYYKDTDAENDSFPKDPDWVPELADIPFTELRGATFRSYIQGWNHKRYKRTAVTSADKAYAPWAWIRGNTDSKFNPVEFVADEFDQTSNGYGVVGGSSIDRYGELMGGLENNDEIYPSLQGMTIDGLGRVDECVDVEPILSDDVPAASNASATVSTLNEFSVEREVDGNGRVSVVVYGPTFTIPEGKHANYDEGPKNVKAGREITEYHAYGQIAGKLTIKAETYTVEVDGFTIEVEDAVIDIIDAKTKVARSASGIPAGTYYPRLQLSLHNTAVHKLHVAIECPNPTLTMADDAPVWESTWSVWIKNVFNTAPLPGESDAQYASRVWSPILGDHLGGEAKMVFASGMLSTSQDYEFTIVDTPVPDRNKSLKSRDGKTYPSEWRITLAKSDADLDVTGKYLPSTMRYAVAGDYFFFIGIDMPHMYVIKAEERLDDWKKDELAKVSEITPAWVVTLDKVRIHNYGKAGALVESIQIGNTFTLADKRFIPGAQEKLYIQSVTYTYNEPSAEAANLLPDVELVLSNEYTVSANPVATLQGDVTALQRTVGSISNVEQIVRAVGDKLYLRKDGIPDRSISPTEFASLLSSDDFRNGIVGGAGWGFYKDENGRWVLEVDRANIRQEMQVNSLVANQVEARGGMIVESAAALTITRVVESGTAYICYFDQRDGSVANLFKMEDVAWCSRFDPAGNRERYYKRMVVRVEPDCVHLALSTMIYQLSNGVLTRVGVGDAPQPGDTIVHYGNYTDRDRQYVKVRDVMGGGYERYIDGLDSIYAAGTEYYFVGRQAGMYNGRPRWYIGDTNGYIEWVDGQLNILGRINALSTIDGKRIDSYIKDAAGDSAPNQLINSAFLNDTAGWRFTGNTWISTDVFCDGVRSAQIIEQNNVTDPYRGIMQDHDVSTGANSQLIIPDGATQVTASAMTYMRGAVSIDKGANVEMFFRDSDGNRMPGSFSVSAIPPTVGVWDTKTITAKIPTGAHSVVFYTYVVRNGELFVAKPQLRFSASPAEWAPSPYDTDYLLEALKGSTQIDGGLVLSRMIQVGDGVSVTAGLNGTRGDTTGGGVAIWAGGTLANAMSGQATYAIRMDGTGYAAGGALRFNENSLGVGDYVVLDSSGLRLFDNDGNVRLQVVNKTVGEEAEYLDRQTVTSPERSTYFSIDIDYKPGFKGPSVVKRGQLNILGSGTAKLDVYNIESSDSTIPLKLKVSFTFSSLTEWDDVYGKVRFCLKRNGEEVQSWTRYFNREPQSTTIYTELNEQVSHAPQGMYTVEASIVAPDNNAVNPIAYGGASALFVKFKSDIILGHEDGTTLGNDGFVTSWGESILMATRSKVVMRYGSNILRVSSDGIKVTNDGKAWRTL